MSFRHLGTACFLGQGGSLTVLDLAAMEAVGAALLPDTATDLVVSGALVYLVLRWQTDLQVVDVADPTGPVVAGSVDMGVRGEAVAVAGGHAFVAAGSDGLRVVDVSRPSAPSPLTVVSSPSTSPARSSACSRAGATTPTQTV